MRNIRVLRTKFELELKLSNLTLKGWPALLCKTFPTNVDQRRKTNILRLLFFARRKTCAGGFGIFNSIDTAMLPAGKQEVILREGTE